MHGYDKSPGMLGVQVESKSIFVRFVRSSLDVLLCFCHVSPSLPDWQSPLCITLDVEPIVTLHAHRSISRWTRAVSCYGVRIRALSVINCSVSAAVLH